jgi:hypothetical protein
MAVTAIKTTAVISAINSAMEVANPFSEVRCLGAGRMLVYPAYRYSKGRKKGLEVHFIVNNTLTATKKGAEAPNSVRLPDLAATIFVAVAITVTIDAVTATLGMADQVADQAACDCTNGRATPAVGHGTADKGARARTDGCAAFFGRARCQCADEGDCDDKLFHVFSP